MAHTHSCQDCGGTIFHMEDYCADWAPSWVCIDCCLKRYPSKPEESSDERKA